MVRPKRQREKPLGTPPPSISPSSVRLPVLRRSSNAPSFWNAGVLRASRRKYDADARAVDAHRLKTRDLPLPTHFHDLKLSNDRVAARGLAKCDDTVCNREDSVAVGFAVVLAEQERRGFASRKVNRKALDEAFDVEVFTRSSCVRRRESKGIDDHDRRNVALHFGADAIEYRREPALQLALEMHEAHGRPDFARVEKRKLLLVSHPLDGRFTDDGEVHDVTFGSRTRERDVMCERCLAATRTPVIRLNENSGIPPPNTASRPGMPDEIVRIGTLRVMVLGDPLAGESIEGLGLRQ